MTIDKVIAMEANGQGFEMVPWKKWIKANKLIYRYELKADAERQIEALHALAAHLGDEYDTVSLIGFVWRRWVKRYHNPFSSSKKLICSESVAIYLKKLGFKIDDTATYTPEDLLELLRSSNDAMLIETSGVI